MATTGPPLTRIGWKPRSLQKLNATSDCPWESTYVRSTSMSVQCLSTPSIMAAASENEQVLSWK
jgi:hypothetical protein